MTTSELGDGERFLVGSLRRWALGLTENNGDHWRFVWYEFETRLGARDGRAGLASFATMEGALQLHARRPLRRHHPCCPSVGADEVRLVAFVAACQLRRRGLAERLAAWVVEPDGAVGMLDAAERLAGLMERHALIVPIRQFDAARPVETERPPALLSAAR